MTRMRAYEIVHDPLTYINTTAQTVSVTYGFLSVINLVEFCRVLLGYRISNVTAHSKFLLKNVLSFDNRKVILYTLKS